MEISDSFYEDDLRDLSYSSLNTEAMNTDAEAFIASITENTVLRNVLAGNIPLYGGKGGKTPLHQHALIISTYLKSAWRLVGGGAQIAKHLVAGIRLMGGDLFRRQNVTSLEAEVGGIRAAVTSDGKSYFAKQFIADFAPGNALSMVKGIPLRKSYLKRIVEVKPTTSFFALYVVFKPGQFPYLKHNVYHYDIANVWEATDYEEEKWPQSWLMYPEASEHKSSFARATTVLAYMHFDEVEKWALSNNTTAAPESRGEDYEDFKRLKAEKLIDAVEKKFSGFRAAIQSYHTATPLTFRDYLNVPQGAAYGNLKDYKLPQQAFISPGSKIPNLFFTGQYLHLHGIKGVSTSALVTCGAILGEPVFEQVMKGIKKPLI
jgi:all-trans-retinol 13,14-reductase